MVSKFLSKIKNHQIALIFGEINVKILLISKKNHKIIKTLLKIYKLI